MATTATATTGGAFFAVLWLLLAAGRPPVASADGTGGPGGNGGAVDGEGDGWGASPSVSTCRLYLAPVSFSAVGDLSGLRLFTAVPLRANSTLSLPDVVINLPDVDYHWRLRLEKERGIQWDDAGLDPYSPAGDGLGPGLKYFTEGDGSNPSPGLFHAKFDAENVTSFAPGVSALARRATRRAAGGKGRAVRGTRPEVDSQGLHRLKDAGVGAFSYYHGHDHVVLQDVPAGAELLLETFPGAGAVSSDLAAAGAGELKTSEWLEERGSCVDHLRAGPSLIPQAGRGAFARRPLPAGSVVAPVPVIPVRRRALERYYRDHEGGPIAFKGDLLVRNYCYGHPESSVMLLPVGPMVNLVNHAPEGTEANVELRWAASAAGGGDGDGDDDGGGDDGDEEEGKEGAAAAAATKNEWLGRSAEEVLSWDPGASINSEEDGNHAAPPFPMLELVALRPLRADDELYLDYGPLWSQAWSSHVSLWSEWAEESSSDLHPRRRRPPILHAVKYVPPSAYNSNPDNLILMTEREAVEASEEPYPYNLLLTCRVPDDIGDRVAFDGEFGLERRWTDVAETRGDTTFWTRDTQRRPCTVLARDESGGDDPSEWTYRVYVDFSRFDRVGEGPEYLLYGVPRRAISLVDRAYAKDQFLTRAYRREIGLKEGMFPEAWMDLKLEREARNVPGADECGLYVAPSSIPNSGLGMYTAKEIPLGTTIFHPDVIVHQYEHDGNNDLRQMSTSFGIRRRGKAAEKPWLLYTYFWESRVARGMHETEDGTQTITMIPGLGMLANSHTGLVNALLRRPEIDQAGLHRSVDPGTGAFSEFYDYRYEAVSLRPDPSKRRPIPAGMELFVEYGDDWFADREWLFGPIPLSGDFADADHLLDRFVELEEALNNTAAVKDLWEITRNMVDWSDRMDRAMPRELDDVRTYRDRGTAMSSVPDAIRSPQWLEEHGRCLDHIRGGRSTISQAGRGAFATRFLPKGTVIAPAPVAHIARKHVEIWERYGPHGEPYFDSYQLLLNYCYGHPRSSLLLFPYSPIVNLINHASARGSKKGGKGGKKRGGPNAKVRWSTMPSHRSDWLNWTVDELLEENHAGLILEFVALRDIEEGEEVLIDYGNLWERAWNDHVRRWKPPEDSEEYVSASTMNEWGGPLRTEEEQEYDPYPPNIRTACYVPRALAESDPDDRTPRDWYPEPRLVDYSDFGRECVILERDDTTNAFSSSCRPLQDYYEARVAHWEYENRNVIVRDIPGTAVELVDRPYTRDAFLLNAFRHEIHAPKGMFPRKWLDLLDEEEEMKQKEEAKAKAGEAAKVKGGGKKKVGGQDREEL